MRIDPELTLGDLARAQGGVFTTVQALRAGFTRGAVAHRLQVGRWVRVDGKVLAASTTSVDSLGHTWVALLLLGSSAVVSHQSAARLWDLDVPDGPLEISTTAARTPRLDGVTIRRRTLPRSDLRTVGGVPTTSRPRTIVDCLMTMSLSDARTLLDRSLQRRQISSAELNRRRAEQANCAGSGQLALLLRNLDPDTHSHAERLLVRIVRGAGLTGWRTNVRVRLGGATAYIDLAFIRARLAIEVDGRSWHTDPTRFQHDRSRQNLLQLAGWTVLRFTWDDLSDRPDHVLAIIQAALHKIGD